MQTLDFHDVAVGEFNSKMGIEVSFFRHYYFLDATRVGKMKMELNSFW